MSLLHFSYQKDIIELVDDDGGDGGGRSLDCRKAEVLDIECAAVPAMTICAVL